MTVKLVAERGTGPAARRPDRRGRGVGQAHRHAGHRPPRPHARRRAHRPRPRPTPRRSPACGTRSHVGRPGGSAIARAGRSERSRLVDFPMGLTVARADLAGRPRPSWAVDLCRRLQRPASTGGWPSCSTPRPSAARRRRRLSSPSAATGGPSWPAVRHRRACSSTTGARDIGDLAERIWYPIWDEGLKLGHAVRTAREALGAGRRRPRHGHLAAAGAPRRRRRRPHRATWPARALEQWQKRAKRWLARARRPGREPPRRGRRGGLPARARPQGGPGRPARRPRPALGRGGPQPAAGRATTRRWTPPTRRCSRPGSSSTGAPAGRATGCSSRSRTPSPRPWATSRADALMHRWPAAARTIAWRSDDAWHRIDASLSGPSGWRSRRDKRHRRPGSCCATARCTSPPRPTRRATPASCCGRRPRRPPRATRASTGPRSTGSRPRRRPLPEPWPAEVRDRASSTCCSPVTGPSPWSRPSTRWACGCTCSPSGSAVRSKPQRNAYHRFTVDRHLMEAAADAAAARGPHRPARPPRGRRAAARHRQGLPRRPHRGRDRAAATASVVAWASRPRTSPSCRRWCATTSCCPTSPPGATSTTRRRSSRRRGGRATP